MTQGSDGSWPGDTDARQVGETLEAAHRSLQAWAEGAVEGPRREAVPGELELELGDVPAAHAGGERARPELRPPEPSEGVARAGPDDPVGLQAFPLLEGQKRLVRLRPAPAVDRADVRVGGPQRHLQGGDVGVAGTGRLPGRREQAKRTDRAHRCGEEAHPSLYSARRPITLIVRGL